jgi:hypothetical protein
MTLADDVNATPYLNGALCRGLGALKTTDRSHVSKRSSTKLAGSVNIDKALEPAQPDAHRWDYLVGAHENNDETRLHWIEFHPASSTGNISQIETKLIWLVNWMETTPLARYPRNIVWVASGKSTFNSRNPELKRLASRGLRFAGSHLAL